MARSWEGKNQAHMWFETFRWEKMIHKLVRRYELVLWLHHPLRLWKSIARMRPGMSRSVYAVPFWYSMLACYCHAVLAWQPWPPIYFIVSFVLPQAQRVDVFSEIMFRTWKHLGGPLFAYKPFLCSNQLTHTHGCENPRSLGPISIQSLALESFFTSCSGQGDIHWGVAMKAWGVLLDTTCRTVRFFFLTPYVCQRFTSQRLELSACPPKVPLARAFQRQ
jgi:hypothetical protein